MEQLGEDLVMDQLKSSSSQKRFKDNLGHAVNPQHKEIATASQTQSSTTKAKNAIEKLNLEDDEDIDKVDF